MSIASLKAVDNFEVSVPGCGKLRWPGLTDVTALVGILPRVVQFKPHEVRVYSDSVLEKPLPGEGLNKRCLYTMENVWARDRATGEYLVDAKSIAAFRAQLLRKADKMGARMIEYDAQKGEWTIEVAHF